MAVTLYRQVGKGKARRYQKINLGRGRCPADLSGPYFLRMAGEMAHGVVRRREARDVAVLDVTFLEHRL